MDRLLARLERRFGRFAIPHLGSYFAGLFALVFVLGMTRPLFLYNLLLIPQLVMKGQAWRLITWVFIPPPTSAFWMIFLVLFYWNIVQSLENAWGTFKLNVFYLIGIAATVIASLATGFPMSSYFLHMSVFLAFGTMFPDYQVRVFFIIPVRMKWLALIDAAIVLYAFATGGWDTRIAVIAALTNYALFLGPHLVGVVRGYGVQARQATRRGEFERPERDARPKRACKICGKSDDDEGADLRVCTCQEVCGGKPTVYCLEHARSHNKQ